MALFDNAAHLHEVDTNVGKCTLIATVRTNRPKGLRKPYEYVLFVEKAKSLYNDLNALFKEKEPAYQIATVWKTGLTRGMKLKVFCLAYRPGFCGPGEGGVNREDWEATCRAIQDVLIKYLGEDAAIYADRYSDDEKFQARFETYIAYEELL